MFWVCVGETQYIDNMAVANCAYRRSMHQCSDTNINHKVCDHVQHKHVIAGWIGNHRRDTEACNAQEREQIRCNGEVDLLAKMATRLPMLDYRCGSGIPLQGRVQRVRVLVCTVHSMQEVGSATTTKVIT